MFVIKASGGEEKCRFLWILLRGVIHTVLQNTAWVKSDLSDTRFALLNAIRWALCLKIDAFIDIAPYNQVRLM